MKIAIGSDELAFEMKETIKKFLQEQTEVNIESIKDCGVNSGESVDYPDIAEKVARSIMSGECDRGILVCGTGIGMAIAATSIVGQSLGAGKPAVARQGAFKSFRFALLIMGGAGLLFFFLPQVLAGFFTNDPDLTRIAGMAIKIAAMEQIAVAAEMVFAGSLRGIGNTKSPMLVAILGTWCFRLPLLWLIVNRLHLGLYQVWFLFVVDWYLRALVLFILFLRTNWRKIPLVSHQSA